MTLTIADRRRGEGGRLTGESRSLQWVGTVVAETDGEGCRDWPFAANRKGYGVMGYNGRTRLVGHVVLLLSGRQRPAEGQQLHSCDRPICAAPWHLRWGTNAENRRESVERGRTSRGEHRPQAKLTEANVRAIRASILSEDALAGLYGVGQSTIHRARVGLTWGHVK